MGKFVQLKDAKTGEPIYPISALPSEFTDEELDEICDFEEGMNEEDVIPKATKDLLGCVVVGDGLNVDANGVLSNAKDIKLLWQNASPTSNFGAQTLDDELADSMSNYDAFILSCGDGNTIIVPLGASYPIYSDYSGQPSYRSFQFTSTGLVVGRGEVNSSGWKEANNRIIPFWLFGIKGVS